MAQSLTTLLPNLQDEYERTIITMLLADKCPDRAQIINSLKPEMFVNATYRHFFKTVAQMHEMEEEINVLSVCEKVSDLDTQRLLQELEKEFITSVNYLFYVRKLVDSYIQRLITNAVTEKDFDYIQKERENWCVVSYMTDIGDKSEELIGHYYTDYENAITTGYHSIDAKLGSFQGGDFVILAGQTSMGKTCMMLNLMLKMAENGTKIDFFSLEMPKKQIQNRIIAAQTSIAADKFRKFTMTGGEQVKYNDYACEGLKKLPIRICDKARITVNEVRKILLKSDAQIVFIDYLGLLCGDGQKNAYERFGDISRELKILAVEANKPIIALHQLNRNTFDRADKRPKVSDLRDSGKIEQDADTILFVYRPAYFDTNQPKELMQFIIAKNRHGESNTYVDLTYDAWRQKISERGTFDAF